MHLTARKNTFFFSVHGAFSRMDHSLSKNEFLVNLKRLKSHHVTSWQQRNKLKQQVEKWHIYKHMLIKQHATELPMSIKEIQKVNRTCNATRACEQQFETGQYHFSFIHCLYSLKPPSIGDRERNRKRSKHVGPYLPKEYKWISRVQDTVWNSSDQ